MIDQDRLRQDYGREGFYAFTEAIDHTQYKVLTIPYNTIVIVKVNPLSSTPMVIDHQLSQGIDS